MRLTWCPRLARGRSSLREARVLSGYRRPSHVEPRTLRPCRPGGPHWCCCAPSHLSTPSRRPAAGRDRARRRRTRPLASSSPASFRCCCHLALAAAVAAGARARGCSRARRSHRLLGRSASGPTTCVRRRPAAVRLPAALIITLNPVLPFVRRCFCGRALLAPRAIGLTLPRRRLAGVLRRRPRGARRLRRPAPALSPPPVDLHLLSIACSATPPYVAAARRGCHLSAARHRSTHASRWLSAPGLRGRWRTGARALGAGSSFLAAPCSSTRCERRPKRFRRLTDGVCLPHPRCDSSSGCGRQLPSCAAARRGFCSGGSTSACSE